MTPTHASPAESPAPNADQLLAQSVLSDHMHLRIPSRPELIEKLAMRLTDRAKQSGVCPEERECGLITSLVEAITNAVVHGNLEIPSSLKEMPDNAFGRMLAERCADPNFSDREVDIHIDDDGFRCTWTISDQGKGFDVDKHLAKIDSDEPQLDLASGRGILMIRALTDGCHWENGGRTIHIHMNREKHTQRSHTRHHMLQPLRAAPYDSNGEVDWNKAFEALATNISAGGLGMLSLESASAKRLLLEVVINGKTVLIPADVRHMTTVDGQMMQIGCAFHDAQTQPQELHENAEQRAAIDRLMAANTQMVATHNERRKHPRTVYTKTISLTLPDGSTRSAVARDLSRTGIAFIGELPLEKGATLQLTLEAESQNPITLPIRIVRSQRMAGRFYDYGAQFVV